MADAPSHRDAAKGRLPTLKGTLTHAHLRDAFALDARAASLYGYFARIAEIEGYPEVATTLRELAEQKSMFADGHLDFLVGTDDVRRQWIGTVPTRAYPNMECPSMTTTLFFFFQRCPQIIFATNRVADGALDVKLP